MLSHGARTFASGFLLQECGMTLWYADRMGLVVSESFDIFMQSPLFLLVVAAHHYGQPHDFGLNPLISLPDGTPHLLTYENTILRLPATIPATLPPIDISPDAASAFDEGAAEVVQPVEFRVDLSDGRQILTAYGTIGRGTSVIPVVAGAGAGAHLDGQRLVAKIACPHEIRTAEDRFIRIIRRKMNGDDHAQQYLKNIVDLKCSFSCKMDDEHMGLPRRKMPAVAIELRRCFRVLVMPEYLPLERINSPAELKQIFVDTITGHHWVYETSLILHRDISYGNIMFYRDGSGAGEKVIGVLTDWDLAEQQLDDGTQANESERAIAANLGIALGGKGSSSGVAVSAEAWEEKDMGEQEKNRQKARYRTGTGPFMACDLLSTGLTPKHLYRHDLESFFWVLVWFCVVFNPDKHTLGIISSWHQSSLLYVGAAKREFMDAAKEYNRIFAKTSLEYQPIGTKYIVPLRIRLQRAIDASTIERHATDKWFQALAMQDENRDESLSAAAEDVEWARTRLRDLVTYKHFMDVLNKPL
ncbi:hypothetical protein EUX98_g9536 [Antrodiella citrinella]|uniref:Fungal-type protein kinase domain-containing protein n=1 Tax=Antrodiella citrinella TaxID=2447956 RepID=A0A4S4LRI8_9APHY|nr:hypothetical protein EUX98_g9536 [Antrodiella citrinella]